MLSHTISFYVVESNIIHESEILQNADLLREVVVIFKEVGEHFLVRIVIVAPYFREQNKLAAERVILQVGFHFSNQLRHLFGRTVEFAVNGSLLFIAPSFVRILVGEILPRTANENTRQ